MPDTDTNAEVKTVPYDRFQTVVNEKNTLSAKIAELERQNQDLLERSATVDTLSKQLRETESKVQEAESRYSTYQAIAGAGITDPELVELTQWSYAKLPEKDRPTLSDWLAGLKADPTKAPAALKPHLTPADKVDNTGRTLPNANAGAVAPRTQQAPLSPEAISKMSREEYKRNREAILQSFGR